MVAAEIGSLSKKRVASDVVSQIESNNTQLKKIEIDMNSKDDVKSLLDAIIQSEVDKVDFSDLRKLVNTYAGMEEAQRVFVRNEIYHTKCNLKILSISAYLAQIAYNEKKEQFVQDALALHSMEDFKWDPRENTIYLSIIWFVLHYLELDATVIFNKVMAMSSEHARFHLNEFYNRPAALKSLKAMGVKAVVKDAKVIFEPDTPSWQR